MKRFIFILLLGTVFVGIGGPIRAQEDAPPATILDVLAADEAERFTTFLAAIDASGLEAWLQAGGPYTLLAPTNEAFEALLAEQDRAPEALLSDAAFLQNVVAYHVLAGRISAAQLADLDDQQLATLLSGASLSVRVSDGTPQLNDHAPIEADLVAENGVVHVLDAVLLPPEDASIDTLFAVALAETPTLYDALNARADAAIGPEFTLARQIITTASFEQDLQQTGVYTFLAPTDEALQRYFDRTGLSLESILSDEEILGQFLRYHLIPAAYTLNDLIGLEEAFIGTALDERLLTLNNTDEGPTLNGFSITEEAAISANGVLLGIDGVLLSLVQRGGSAADDTETIIGETIASTATLGGSGDASLLDVVNADPDLSTFARALEAAEVTALLDDNGPFTLFAPTNAAIDAFLAEQGLSLDDLLGDYPLLARTLLYHLVAGRFNSDALATLAEERLITGLHGTTLLVGEGPTLNGINISRADQAANNGVIHVIDGVLLPEDGMLRTLLTDAEGDIATWLSEGETTTLFFAAINAAGLGDALANSGPYTLFVPSDDALTAFLAQRGESRSEFLNNTAALQAIVLYHIVPYRYPPEALPTSLGYVGTLAGSPVGLSRDAESGLILVNDARVIDDAHVLGNGIIYLIDDVLTPAE